LGPQVLALDHAPIVDDLSLSEGVVALEEVEEHVYAEVQNEQQIDGTINALRLQLFLEEIRPEGQRQRDLQLHDVEHEEVEEIPSEREGGERIDVEVAEDVLSLLFGLGLVGRVLLESRVFVRRFLR
jgi:hypothetical protein